MKLRLLVGTTLVCMLAAAPVSAGQVTVTEGHQGWGGPLFDFTETITEDGVDYFGWDPLMIDGSWDSGIFTFDISMPRVLSDGDNFDLVIDWDNDGYDSDGDFLVHYAHNLPPNDGGGWDDTWDAKIFSGGWAHADLADLPTVVDAETPDARNFTISFAGASDLSYQWLSPLGDQGYPASWPGEAVVIGFWNGNAPGENIPVAASAAAPVPEPASMALWGLLGLGTVATRLVRRRRQAVA